MVYAHTTQRHTPTNVCQAKQLYNLSQKKNVLANGLQFPGKRDPLTLKFRTMTLFCALSARSKTVFVLNISLC